MSEQHNENSQPIDLNEIKEWLDALQDVTDFSGNVQAEQILNNLLLKARELGLNTKAGTTTAYINTIPAEKEAPLPDDGKMMLRLTDYMQWNAAMIVLRATSKAKELGGHLSSFAGVAMLFEVGLNYVFRADDLVYFQAHSSPGLYARAFLEGRLSAKMLDRFRQEANQAGISSYPHPWLMPEFWQFPTVSMGLGPLFAIYNARFLKYMHNRGMANTEQRHVWAFCGDGELGEPESLGALNIAGREKLDNLIFVISCNLQRLDGPVWGNGQIIQEYEGVFRGAGWNVIKVIWGGGWDDIFAKDKTGVLLKRIGELVDGEYQNYASKDGAYMREHFFGKSPELLALVADKTDEQLKKLLDGGHDPRKVYAAYKAAVEHKGQPTVILAKTVKGFRLGAGAEGLNIAHNLKTMSLEHMLTLRDRLKLPLTDKQVEKREYYKPKADSPEIKYLLAQREKLGGFLPQRKFDKVKLHAPKLDAFEAVLKDSGDREFSSTMGFSRVLSVLLKDKELGKHIVPILADETRTFGMEGLFRQIGIYSPYGQRYEPEDKKQLMYYREATDGQLIQDGISEAGGMCSWLSAATSYSSNNVPMIPFFIYYSQFGFQRFGDLAWLAGDIRARGFIIGGTAGRTTLAGEGLQHQDGANLLMFSFVPNCVTYDPTFAYEMAVIIQDGIKRMMQKHEDVYYYITAMNENYPHPGMPKGCEQGILRGMYLLRAAEKPKAKLRAQLMGSGTILREVIQAAEILRSDYNVEADIWSVTSFNELRRDKLSVERHNRYHPSQKPTDSYIKSCLAGQPGPVIAATDYMKMFADQVRSEIDAPYYVLGTDGFGRSDTRVELRHFFEVDAKYIVYTTLYALMQAGKLTKQKLAGAIKKLGIDPDKQDPTTV